MFKILILAALHETSDERMEFLIQDRLSWLRFLGFELGALGVEPGWPLGSIVGDIHSVEPEYRPRRTVAASFFKDHRTETAAQMFPCCGSGVAFSEDLLQLAGC